LIASNRYIVPRKESNKVDKSGFDIKPQPKKITRVESTELVL